MKEKQSTFLAENNMDITSKYLAGRDVVINEYHSPKQSHNEKRQIEIIKWSTISFGTLLFIILSIILYQELSPEQSLISETIQTKNDNLSEQTHQEIEVAAVNKDWNRDNKAKKEQSTIVQLPSNQTTLEKPSNQVPSLVQKKEYFVIRLHLNSDFMDGNVLVDGEKATIVSDNATIKEIRVLKKEDSHHFQIISNKDTCSTSALIIENNQEINCSDI